MESREELVKNRAIDKKDLKVNGKNFSIHVQGTLTDLEGFVLLSDPAKDDTAVDGRAEAEDISERDAMSQSSN